MNELAAALKRLLADQITMYLKAHGFHWNVEGPMFVQFHDFFSSIYEDVYGSIDPTAENIRKLREYAPFGIGTIDKLREIEDSKVSTDPIAMCVDLLDANTKILECIHEASDLAEAMDEEGIMNFLAERDDMHKKWRWQLESTIKMTRA